MLCHFLGKRLYAIATAQIENVFAGARIQPVQQGFAVAAHKARMGMIILWLPVLAGRGVVFVLMVGHVQRLCLAFMDKHHLGACQFMLVDHESRQRRRCLCINVEQAVQRMDGDAVTVRTSLRRAAAEPVRLAQIIF